MRLKVVLLVRLTFEARNRDSESESYSAFDELEPDSREGDRVERVALSLQHAPHRRPLLLTECCFSCEDVRVDLDEDDGAPRMFGRGDRVRRDPRGLRAGQERE